MTIKKTALLLLMVCIVLILSILAVNHILLKDRLQRSEEFASIINRSGRQRMLSQKFNLEILKLDTYSFSTKSLTNLRSLTEELERSQIALVQFTNTATNITESKRKSMDSLLAITGSIIENAQHSYKTHDRALLENMANEMAVLLETMEQVTEAFEKMAIQNRDTIASYHARTSLLLGILILIILCSALMMILKSLVRKEKERLVHESQLKSSLEERKREINKLTFLTQSLRIGFWQKDVSLDKETWSPELYEILGYKNQEIVGTAENFIELVHPADRQILFDAYQATRKSYLASRIELRVKTKNRGYKWVAATGSLQRDESGKIVLLMGGIRDIDSRKKTEDLLKVMISESPTPIVMLDADRRIRLLSTSWIDSFRLQAKLLINEVITEQQPYFSDILASFSAEGKKVFSGLNQIQVEANLSRWYKWEVKAWKSIYDESDGLIIMCEDVSELIKAQEKVLQASKSQERLFANITHDLRSPLSAVVGLTDLLISDDPKKEQLEPLKMLKYTGENLIALTNDLLDLSKIASNNFKLEIRDFNLLTLVDNIKRSFKFKAAENRITLDYTYDAKLPEWYQGDEIRFYQILNNLVSNAIKFTKDGNVNIQVSLIEQKGNDFSIAITVADTGIGIAEENLQKIFEEFQQAEENTTRIYGGTGLGLSITRSLASLMGGQISVKSVLNKGSQFTVSLTLPKGKDHEINPEDILEDDYHFSDQLINILIAEDFRENQEFASKLLRRKGITYEIVTTGKEALKKIESQAYDLILMDLEMPEMDGLAASTKIRSLPDHYYQEIPIIAVTAQTQAETPDRIREAGMNHMITKPFRANELYRCIKKYAGLV